jgi:hypothetical protein
MASGRGSQVWDVTRHDPNLRIPTVQPVSFFP